MSSIWLTTRERDEYKRGWDAAIVAVEDAERERDEYRRKLDELVTALDQHEAARSALERMWSPYVPDVDRIRATEKVRTLAYAVAVARHAAARS